MKNKTSLQIIWQIALELVLLSFVYIVQNLFFIWAMWSSSDGSDPAFILNAVTLVGTIVLGIYIVVWAISLIIRLEIAKDIAEIIGSANRAGEAAQ